MPNRPSALADPERAAAYFAALTETHSTVAAAKAIGMSHATVIDFRRRNPAFSAHVNTVLGRPVDYDRLLKNLGVTTRRAFLDKLAEFGCAQTAADAAGVATSTVYGLRRRDMAFAAAWAAARDETNDRAYGRLLRQAIHGFERNETVNGVEKRIVTHEAGTVLKLLDRYEAQRSRQPGTGRFIEITPERVAAARTTLLRRLTSGGGLTTMAEAVARAAATPATVEA